MVRFSFCSWSRLESCFISSVSEQPLKSSSESRLMQYFSSSWLPISMACMGRHGNTLVAYDAHILQAVVEPQRPHP